MRPRYTGTRRDKYQKKGTQSKNEDGTNSFGVHIPSISHYPAETGTRITIPDAASKENAKSIDMGVADVITNVIGHTMAGRQIVPTKRFIP